MYDLKKMTVMLLVFSLIALKVVAQHDYVVSSKLPYGQLNPEAPKELADFKQMIGTCDCRSVQRNAQGQFGDTINIVWQFKYILNGLAIQDETWKEDGTYTSSIRQYNSDSLAWYVTFFSGGVANPSPSTWSGNRNESGHIILKLPQKAPNEWDGYSKLSFYDISEKGFKWLGAWVDEAEQVNFPFWAIDCTKRE